MEKQNGSTNGREVVGAVSELMKNGQRNHSLTFTKENLPLFQQLTELKIGDDFFDLHNEFDLVDFCKENNQLVLFFKSLDAISTIRVDFTGVIYNKFDLRCNTTIDNFHRCRFEKEGELFDVVEEKMAFILEFVPIGFAEISASRLNFSLLNNKI